ncbi:MAG: Serine/threonine protein kinase PrkC, regulator of stationary phase [Myxococcales bacterium]|nr:Serine/threonine protein kinase PrkC, regulator of stationary phase [Myxococcales bacterium]
MLDYEKLDVYPCAIEHLAFEFRSIPNLPRGDSALLDQWRRAAMSVPLNIAEAVDDRGRERARGTCTCTNDLNRVALPLAPLRYHRPMAEPPKALGTPRPALAEASATTVAGIGDTDVGRVSEAPTLVPGTRTAKGVIVLPPAGYLLGLSIGKGGMGEVLAAQDTRIGREVAVKRMTSEAPDDEQIARFLREARIQARLEHPSIVPVHELGVDEQGRPYFTMKRLVGSTLGQRQVDGMTLNRLLRAFVEVCRAIEFAHSRGVVHRDLKPTNIMTGDFGEVYVIDWGIARVLTDEPEKVSDNADIGTLDEHTKEGSLLGTPGYMAPEQIRGQRATPPADVYALGSILFELLCGELLHRRGQAGLASTLANPTQSPAQRTPDRPIPPELDALCVAALAETPEARPTAHALAEGVQDYLDGDRDVERRRQIAAQQLASAREVLASNDPEARATAMRSAGRALALDPQSEDAAALVSSLLLAPPPMLPPDLAAGLEEQELAINRDRSRKSMWVYLSVFAMLPFALIMEIKNWPMVIGFFGTLGVAALASAQFARSGRPAVPVVLLVNLMIAVLFTRIAGPFVLTPLMVCCTIVALTSIPWINQRTWVIIAWTVVAVMTPIVLEWTGILPKTWEIAGGRMTIISDVVRTTGLVDELSLIFASLLFTLVLGMFALGISRRRRIGQQQLFVQAWHLRQLLPSSRRPWATQPR